MREWLKKIRLNNDLTQENMGKKLGISQNNYSCIENGERQIRMEIQFLSKVSSEFDIPIEDLLKAEMEYCEKR